MHRGHDGSLDRSPGLRSDAGARPARAPARKEIAPRPRAEGGGEGRGRAAKRRAEGPASGARSVLNGLGGRIVRPRGRGVGTEKGGWKAETFL